MTASNDFWLQVFYSGKPLKAGKIIISQVTVQITVFLYLTLMCHSSIRLRPFMNFSLVFLRTDFFLCYVYINIYIYIYMH
jgi:hypothetical protein